jgi:hypothetical protein|tara:strand:+ start:981 stop:1565 length:585 start_codon:yes stop_codon:yes gene_type:complete
MAGKINMASIKTKAMNSPRVSNAVQNICKAKFNQAKASVLREFLDDVVTREIRGGANVSNASGTLGGYGNLFSYIGFYDGFDPIAPIEEYITNFPFQAKVINRGRGVNLSVQVKFPSIEKIKQLSGMPWEEGNSWVMGIERGISGFSNYMYDMYMGKGRSGTAIQKKNKSGTVTSFSTRRYLPSILADIKRKFK